MKVFKFGGASVKNADAIKNVAQILSDNGQDKLIVVVSAMGKTTNLLEKIAEAYFKNESLQALMREFTAYHNTIIEDLELNPHDINSVFQQLSYKLSIPKSDNFHFEYDQIVSFGELLSTTILNSYLQQNNFDSKWLDARSIIKTDTKWREGKVNWDMTANKQNEILEPIIQDHQIIITQGFIGSTLTNHTTTLGREGSDFTAAIFAYITNAESVTIWKDVPGMLNADPKFFDGTVLLEQISFKEAIELAYYGASVIHPKTIQPLKNKDIPLFIRSFINPTKKGTTIQSSMAYDANVASYIFKPNQALISLTPKDFSFIIEDNLKDIFSILSEDNIRVNLMQNSAVSFSFLIDNKHDLNEIVNQFNSDYIVKYNDNVEMLTIRHFKEDTIERLTANKTILLEQKTRQTARLVLK
ncbi:MAG: aspartate kinase [Putridiphycobacter sp.]